MFDKVIHTPLRDLYDILQKDQRSSHFFKQCFKVSPPHVLIEYQFFRAILKNYFWSKSVFCFSILLESSYKLHKLWIIFTSNAVIYIVRICHVTNVKLPEHQQTRWSEQARYLKFKWLQQTMTISLTNNEPFRQIGLFD